MKTQDKEIDQETVLIDDEPTWVRVLQWVFAVALIGIAAFLWGPGIYRAVRHNPWLTFIILVSVFLAAGFKNTIISWFSGGIGAVTNGARNVYPATKQFMVDTGKRWGKPWPEKFGKYPRWQGASQKKEQKEKEQ